MLMNQENLQMFAHHKGGGSSANGRDSAGRRLGTKVADGQDLTAGSIIYRQRGTHIYPGVNVKKGGSLAIVILSPDLIFETFLYLSE